VQDNNFKEITMARINVGFTVDAEGNLTPDLDVHLRAGDFLVFNEVPPGANGVHADLVNDVVALYVRDRAAIAVQTDACNNVIVSLDAIAGGAGPDENP
jgi:hypothetical protein